MLPVYNHQNGASSIVLNRNERYEHLTRDYYFLINKKLPALGIRYLHYYEPDNTLVVSNTCNGCILLINLATGLLRSFTNHTQSVRKILMHGGEIFTASWDGSVRATNYLTLEERLRMTDRHMGRCPFINITPDGRHLYSFTYDSDIVLFGVADTVRKWSVRSGRLLKILSASPDQQNERRSGSVIFYENRVYVCCDNGYFTTFDMKTGNRIRQLYPGADFRSMTSLFRYNYLIASDWDGYLHFYNLKTEKFEFKIKCHNTDIQCIRVHPKNPDIIITSGGDGMVRVWEMPGFKLLSTILTDSRDLWSMVFINDTLAIGNHAEIQVWDMSDIYKFRFKGRIVISDKSFTVQAIGSKMFFTNDLSTMEVFNVKDGTMVSGSEAGYLLAKSNSLTVMRELFGIKDDQFDLLTGRDHFKPLLQEKCD